MNKETAHFYLPFVQALADGKTIELFTFAKGWEEIVETDFCFTPNCYRIKPEPKMIPLGPEDVPPGSAFRRVGDTQWWMASSVDQIQVNLGQNGWSTYETLQKCFEIERPGEDWMPCHKPA